MLPDAIAVCTNERNRRTERAARDGPGGERVHEHSSGISPIGSESNAAARAGAIGPKSYFPKQCRELVWTIGKTVTVVVIDDDLGVRRGLARLLRASGFEVATYASAEAFLFSPPDDTSICLVLDIHLGGMSGLELADCLDEEERSVPIVFISAQEGALPEERAASSGTIAFLRKPVDESVLIEAVSRALLPG